MAGNEGENRREPQGNDECSRLYLRRRRPENQGMQLIEEEPIGAVQDSIESTILNT